MRVFYDTEFIEDGRTIDLISIGMVAEDGRELYAVAQEIQDDPLKARIRGRRWLMEHVIPHLPLRTKDGISSPLSGSNSPSNFWLDQTSNLIMPRRMIRNAVCDFLRETQAQELWAYYGAYDHIVLAQLFGAMVNRPDVMPMWTNDIMQKATRLGVADIDERVPPVGAQHNALDDARHVKAMYDYLRSADLERYEKRDVA